MHIRKLSSLSGLFLCLTSSGAAQADVASSERDYFEELPVVLSVSRLAQPLDETPGAVTVIDRDSIRRLGARDVYDVLRFVPGFLVSGWNGASPIAAYHNALDQVGSKLQVFVDGRSVYSTFFLGGSQRGLQGIILEDVERIEVLRGSNSAAYGANAFLGVVNIVTRHTADTRGALASITHGQDGIDDNTVRYGWGSDDASFRISTAHRADSGRERVYDDSRNAQLNLRADLRPTAQDEVMLQAGNVENSWGDGKPTEVGNPERTPRMRNAFVLGEWRRWLGAGEDLRVSFSHDDETYRDRTPYTKPGALYQGVFLDWGGKSRRTQFEFQHAFVPASGWRAVWGSTVRDERVWSPPLYYGRDWISSRQWRLFGNLEWRLNPEWLINAGALWEKTSSSGTGLSPRLMVNYHALPGQTLRAGVTKSQRVPTLFEENADVRYFNAANRLAGWTWNVRGQARPENLLVREVGYLGEFRPLGLSLDLRAYQETLTDAIVASSYFNGTTIVTDKINSRDKLRMRGWEYQVRWQPGPATRIWWSHLTTRNAWAKGNDTNMFSSPHRTDSLVLFQTLADNIDLTLTYAETGPMVWESLATMLPYQHRADVRLAKRFLVGKTRVEAAVTVQAANGGYQEYVPTRIFERRAFATLRLEY
jgi:iron complex outermembrane receptor protein